MLRVLIIDDEAPARRYLCRLLEAAPGILIEGEAATLEDGRRMIRDHRPDALFLDIALNSGTGFDLLEGLEPAPAVVFVTAHDDYATRPFDVRSIDYLLKPVSPDRLRQTLARLRPHASRYLATRTRTGTRLVKIHELSLIEAQGDYVRLCRAAHASELIHMTLKRLAAQLPSPPFCAVSRSVILNLDHISHLANKPGARAEVSFSGRVPPIVLGRAASLRLRRAMAQRPMLAS